MPRTCALALAALTLALCTAPTGALGAGFAPPSTAGPALSVPQATIESRLACSPGLAGAKRAPVLLVQGTGATAQDNWSWTYEPALDKLGIAWCAIDLPDHATSDVQVNGEYVVGAIRAMHARAGRRISIIGQSQGGMVPRWALRFWPDTRAMVDDLIGFVPSNHGTTKATCDSDPPCSAATWQQSDESNFMKALNSFQETFAPVSYTSVYTRTDETVQPNMDESGSSSLRTGDGRRRNVATQDICPNDVYEHLATGTVDPVAYRLAVDALDHDGPADPARVSPLTCAETLHPGIDRTTFAASAAAAAVSFETYKSKQLPKEPALACYTTAGCAPAAGASNTPAARRCASRRRFTVHVPLLRGVRATVGGRALRLHRRGGRLVGTVDLKGRRAGLVVLRFSGRDAAGRRVRQTRRYHPCRR
jgi:triacylglycerol esterase/lipase EstA (alpha/beta hydrolase family)